MQAFWSPKGESWSQAFLAWPAEIGNESALACVIMCSSYVLALFINKVGAIHSSKISGLRFKNFLRANGSRRVRKVLFFLAKMKTKTQNSDR